MAWGVTLSARGRVEAGHISGKGWWAKLAILEEVGG